MKEPAWTCSDIDNIKKELARALYFLGDDLTETHPEDFDSAKDTINGVIRDIEYVRQSNKDLRAWGQYWKDTYEDLASERGLK